MEHQRYLDDVTRQQQEADMARNQEAIDGLQGLQAELDAKKTEAAAAKTQFEAYNPAAIADRPADWTEDLAIEKEVEFFDLQKEVGDMQKAFNEV
jgi:hypothetical protein